LCVSGVHRAENPRNYQTNQPNSIQTVQRLHLKWPAATSYHSAENTCSNKRTFSVYAWKC